MAGGLLFDVDGTLVDTTYLHTVTWWEALRQYEFDAPMTNIHRAIGMGSDKILDQILGPDRDRDHDDEIRAAHTALYATYRTRLRPLPGAADLLRECAARGWTIGLASSASPQDFAALMRALDADEVIAGATNKGDAERSKPDPVRVTAGLGQCGTGGRGVRVGTPGRTAGEPRDPGRAAGGLDLDGQPRTRRRRGRRFDDDQRADERGDAKESTTHDSPP